MPNRIGQELPTVHRGFNYLFEIELLQQILAAQVDNHGEGRPYMNNIGEVLVGSYSPISPSLVSHFLQFGNHMNIGNFIGDQIVGVEVTRCLADGQAYLLQLLIGQGYEGGFLYCNGMKRGNKKQRSEEGNGYYNSTH